MADYAAEDVSSNVGSTVTARTGTASADTVPAGSLVLWRNTGAGTHIVTLTTNNTVDGLDIANRTISIANGAQKAGRVKSEWGDANGRVQVGIDGTPGEVVYYVLGGV